MSRRVLILTYPGCMSLDVAGPADTFVMANVVYAEHTRKTGNAPAYVIGTAAPNPGSLEAFGSVVSMNIQRACDEITNKELEELDLLVICGGVTAMSIRTDPTMLAFLKRAATRVKRFASICTGALILAEAELLEGRKVATHWRVAEQLKVTYPNVDVKRDSFVCRDGNVWSSGGITSGIDLALAIVETDLGTEVARAVARLMVTHLSRRGGQSQYEKLDVNETTAVGAEDVLMREIYSYIRMHPAADLKRSTLAEKFNLTERTLARRFDAYSGRTIGKFVEESRVSHAQIRLESSGDPLVEVALRSGFPSAEAMRRAFSKRFSITPTEFRERFRGSMVQAAE